MSATPGIEKRDPYITEISRFYDDDFERGIGQMLEFRLVYQGSLHSSGNDKKVQHKHKIRRYFHRQLERVWQLKQPLKSRIDRVPGTNIELAGSKKGINAIAEQFSMNGKHFVPIVTEDLALACKLDILLLGRAEPNRVIQSGDIDGRLKTIIDALRLPQIGEYNDGPEDPLYCLLQDDKLISEVKVYADVLLPSKEQIFNPEEQTQLSDHHAIVIIHAQIVPTRQMWGNLDFF